MKTRLLLLALGVIGVIANPVPKQTIESENKSPQQTKSIESQYPQTKHEESNLNNGSVQKKVETNDITEPCDRKYGEVDIIIEESVVDTVGDTANLANAATSTDDGAAPTDFVLSPNDDAPTLSNDPNSLIDKIPSSIDDAITPMDAISTPFEEALRPIDDAMKPIESLPIPLDIGSSIKDDFSFDIAPRPNEDAPILFNMVTRPIDNAHLPFEVAPQIPEIFEDDFPVNDIPFRDAPLNTISHEIMETAAGFAPPPSLLFRRKQMPQRRFANRRHFRPKHNPFRRKFHFFYPYYGFYRPSSLRFY